MKCGQCGRKLPEDGTNPILCECGTYNCTKCGHFWKPRVQNPRRCPRCQVWLIPKPNEAKT